ncbi:MAG TPA: dienelactone hydrolase family protein [Rhodopila sp.]|uniref:dienelactone hydrolase family protein n=1 Tax=Rhodopila sp. TaxID=2480087 RepID=UPI002BF77A1C|nr:dienelactone hydrolase family protein [Rhodopila sp.]HVY16646.1 dienelactone hydrolase family protein [Rhodopila sp.]
MQEEIRDIQTRAGAMETFIVHPDRGGPHPVVIMQMDAPGIREELYDMARRLCSVGYYVLLPNLYYRAGKDTKYGPDVLEKGSAEQQRMRAVRTKMTIPPVMEDIADMLAFVATQPAAKPGPVGTHGYCMSGPYALAAAARYPDRIVAAASFYGTWLVSDAEESPHLNLGKAKGELYIGCAEHDELAPLPMVEELKGLFQKSGNRGELELYPAVHHGFAFPQRWCYDKPAAERHWERLIALYRRNLG